MQVKDGYEASKEIFLIQNNLRKIGENDEVNMNKKCEIIALTSFSDYQTFEICKRIGMKEVINKPIS